jgi:hypothetical protein
MAWVPNVGFVGFLQGRESAREYGEVGTAKTRSLEFGLHMDSRTY